MEKATKTEVWLRGPLPDMPALLQPVAHALMQAQEETNALLTDFPETHLWLKVAGLASVGFHLQHMCGVLDRLFTYADGHELSDEQLNYLKHEGQKNEQTTADLLSILNRQINITLEKLRHIDELTVTAHRGVGRAQLPSTVIGLLVHMAEHTMRHTGQLLVTVSVIKTW